VRLSDLKSSEFTTNFEQNLQTDKKVSENLAHSHQQLTWKKW
jgi:hypothetical protein